jgi:hypothetical protein
VIREDHRFDHEELPHPLAKADMRRFAKAQCFTHPFLDLGRHGERHLRHRVAGGELQQQEDHEADEQQRRDR